MNRRYAAAALISVFLLGSTSASAREVEIFTFVIDHGLTLTSRTDANGETISVSSGKLRSVVNGRKNFDNQGTGYVTFWKRTVPDPFFAALGSRASLIVFNFDPLFDEVRVYLGQIETPAGPRTTIGVLEQDEITGKIIGPVQDARGQWVILPASSVIGANFDDLVIQATVVINENFLNLGTTRLALVGHAANPPFASDAVPGGMHFVDPATRLGSFYGETTAGGQTVPVRAFSSSRAPALWSHLLVVKTGFDYTVVACWDYVATTTPRNCAVSGIGPTLGNTAGAATYFPGATSTTLALTRTIVP